MYRIESALNLIHSSCKIHFANDLNHSMRAFTPESIESASEKAQLASPIQYLIFSHHEFNELQANTQEILDGKEKK